MDYIYSSPIGKLLIKHNGDFLSGLSIMTGASDISDSTYQDVTKENSIEYPHIITETCQWLDDYFKKKNPQHIPPIRLEGSTFQKYVWNILMHIPYGMTTTYKEIASEIAQMMKRESMSAQAVGQAVGHNPIGIIIPCHRVIGSNGCLTGFAWGIEKKAWLLQHEKQALNILNSLEDIT